MSAAQAGKEMTKTLLFVGAAIASLAIAFFTRPPAVSDTMDEEVGTALFASLNDPAAANGLSVLSYNEELGEMKEFKVSQKKGVWVIPSHQNYPADAQERLVNAATMFTDLNVVGVVSEKEAEHETFGVVEPSVDKTRVGDEGVGTLVEVSGKGDEGQGKLAALIIGKEVKGMEGQHYVRRPGKSRVYQVKIDPSQLSTKFKDWIETDLLKLSAWDVASVTMKDYSMDSQQTIEGYRVSEEKRTELKVTDNNGTWELAYLRDFDSDNQPVAGSLEEGEELNKERLDTLKNALGDLKIVDVEAKPKGLGADLKADKAFLEDMESISSLARRGFFALRNEEGVTDLKCGDGELIVDTKEGVEYVLRFGRIAGMSDDETTEDGGEKTSSSVNRYMFVSVRVNEAQFPQPELEALPPGADSLKTSAEETEKADEENAGESEAGNKEADADATNSQNELALEVERIEKANQRKIDERNDKIEVASKKVSELSFRFADWYYIVSDDVFKKLRLRRDDVISFSEEALKSGTGIGAFRNLQVEGIQGAEPATP